MTTLEGGFHDEALELQPAEVAILRGGAEDGAPLEDEEED